ncbi:MAG: hypothetical protein J6V47_05765 [Bacteroidaceae bacterium]|nr:hypothetical protein [Bacteroidaceae bacterium]
MITTFLSIAAALMLQISEPVQNESFVVENNAVEMFSAEDQCLGEVNLCDPNGATCFTGTAYKSEENGRIYVKCNAIYWAQKSNNPNWEYMIRMGDIWLYFSF